VTFAFQMNGNGRHQVERVYRDGRVVCVTERFENEQARLIVSTSTIVEEREVNPTNTAVNA